MRRNKYWSYYETGKNKNKEALYHILIMFVAMGVILAVTLLAEIKS